MALGSSRSVYQLMLCHAFVISLMQLSQSQDNPCISFQNGYEHKTTCSSSSTWAVDLPALTVSHVAYTDEDPSFLIAYYLILKNATSIALCEIFVGSSSCYATGINCISCESNQIGKSNGSVISTFKITNLGSDKDGCNLTYDLYSEAITNTPIHSFSISGCKSPISFYTTEQNGIFNVTSKSYGYYNDTGTCTCLEDGQELFYPDGIKHDGIALCGPHAKWMGCEKVQCWSGPHNITVKQLNTTAGAAHPVFACSFMEGFPNSTSSTFKVNNIVVSQYYILKSYDNEKILVCEVHTPYTEAKYKTYSSPPILVTVYYPPENSSLSNYSPAIKINDSMILNYSFFANPHDGETSMTLVFSFCYTSIQEESDQDYGSYEICASTINPSGKDCVLLSIYEAITPTLTPLDPEMSGLAISLLVAGVVVFTAAIASIILYICHKRKGYATYEPSGGRGEIILHEPNPGYDQVMVDDPNTGYEQVTANNQNTCYEEVHQQNTGYEEVSHPQQSNSGYEDVKYPTGYENVMITAKYETVDLYSSAN